MRERHHRRRKSSNDVSFIISIKKFIFALAMQTLEQNCMCNNVKHRDVQVLRDYLWFSDRVWLAIEFDISNELNAIKFYKKFILRE